MEYYILEKGKEDKEEGEKEKKKRTLFEFICNDLQDKVNLKNPGMCSMLPLVGEIKEVICMSSEKISKNLTTEFVRGNKAIEIQEKKENLFFIMTSFITFEFLP